MTQFVLGLAQCRHPEDGDAVALVERTAAQALERGVELLVFPESLMTRYEEELEGFLAAAQPVGGAFCEQVSRIAKRFGLWIVYTMNELAPDGAKPYNTAILVDDAGCTRKVYRKIHLFDSATTRESERMSAGADAPSCIDTPFGRIGLGICYDLRFPEFARMLACDGCELLLYPAAWVAGPHKIEQWKTLLSARAVENELFVAGLSRCDEGYSANSCIVDPDGVIIAEAHQDEELLCARVDTEAIRTTRERIPVFEHRRTDIYRL